MCLKMKACVASKHFGIFDKKVTQNGKSSFLNFDVTFAKKKIASMSYRGHYLPTVNFLSIYRMKGGGWRIVRHRGGCGSAVTALN